jgi:hypothetical protein
MKTFLVNPALARIAASALLVAAAAAAAAPEPAQNIDPARHGNLATAQTLVRDAYDKLSAAQTANHGELGGHAARAKELMREANDEIKLAAIAANGNVAPTLPLASAPAGVVYVAPTYVSPGPGWGWGYHARYGWGWHHPAWGWHRGWY